MENNTMSSIEIAITLGVKKELRHLYNRLALKKRIKDVLDKYRYDYILYSTENYETTGEHVHVYYVGQPILWSHFNKQWEIGYVKNRGVYSRNGWMRYVKKHGGWYEHGQLPVGLREEEEGRSPMEALAGITLEEAIMEQQHGHTLFPDREEAVTEYQQELDYFYISSDTDEPNLF
jgi:hypothetical protein